MARIELRGLGHRYAPGGDWAVQPLDLTLDHGGAYALLGPSGCGKTTLLNVISGLLVPSHGSVALDGRDVTREPPHRRNIAQVFQFPVVYGTMTVEENLEFPLRNRGIARAEAAKRAREIAALLELDGDLARKASVLAPHKKQALSLGRGLVRTDVAAILLDEPLTVVDPQLKWRLRRQLKAVHHALAVTLVYVTHDQTEALTFADRVLVMDRGRVVQQGTPRELYEDPADPFVGRFIGSPGMNLLACKVEGGAAVVAGQKIPLPPGAGIPKGFHHLLGIRPDFVRPAAAGAHGAIRVTVTGVEDLGRFRLVTARIGGETLLARLEDAPAPALGEGWLELPQRWIRIFVAPPADVAETSAALSTGGRE